MPGYVQNVPSSESAQWGLRLMSEARARLIQFHEDLNLSYSRHLLSWGYESWDSACRGTGMSNDPVRNGKPCSKLA